MQVRLDCWGAATAAKAAGIHCGWDLLRPAYNAVRIMAWYPGAQMSASWAAWAGSLDSSRTWMGQARVSLDAMMAQARADGLDVLLCVDCQVDDPYHDPPPAGGRRSAYWPWISDAARDEYVNFCDFLAERYQPRWLQIGNEISYQRGGGIDTPVYDDMYTETMLEVKRQIGYVRLVGGYYEGWTSWPVLSNEILGRHHAVLYTPTDPANAVAYYKQIEGWKSSGREVWLDETLPVGRYGKIDATSAEIYRAVLRYLWSQRHWLKGVCLGFAGGLESPCSAKWKVCAGLLDGSGRLTLQGQAVVDVAKELGFWAGDVAPPTQPDWEEIMYKQLFTEALGLAARAEKNARAAAQAIKEADYDKAKKKVRQVVRRLDELEALAEDGDDE